MKLNTSMVMSKFFMIIPAEHADNLSERQLNGC